MRNSSDESFPTEGIVTVLLPAELIDAPENGTKLLGNKYELLIESASAIISDKIASEYSMFITTRLSHSPCAVNSSVAPTSSIATSESVSS